MEYSNEEWTRVVKANPNGSLAEWTQALKHNRRVAADQKRRLVTDVKKPVKLTPEEQLKHNVSLVERSMKLLGLTDIPRLGFVSMYNRLHESLSVGSRFKFKRE